MGISLGTADWGFALCVAVFLFALWYKPKKGQDHKKNSY